MVRAAVRLWLDLPPAQKASTVRAPIGGIDPTIPISILLVDDDEAHSCLITLMLEIQGYRVLVANSGATALEFADQADVAIVDMVMPGLSGLESIPLLQCSNPNLKILACSGSDEEQFRADLDQLGVDRFLAKPFLLDRLLEAIDSVLGEKIA